MYKKENFLLFLANYYNIFFLNIILMRVKQKENKYFINMIS